MPNCSREDVLRIADEHDVKFIRLQFSDILGVVKNVAVPRSQLEKALDNEIMFDGSSIDGFTRIEESDMNLRPVLDSFAVLPWRPKHEAVARLICDVYGPNDQPFAGDPRYILRKVLDEAYEMGYFVNLGPECEFFLFKLDEQGHPTLTTHDKAGYFDLAPADKAEDARREIVLALEEMGFEVEASHHEVAEGQHEIDFKYDDALTTADRVATFKVVTKAVAQKHGLHATFMPKPVFGINGSGMHTHISLFKGNTNAFYDKNGKHQLSESALHFIGGLLAHVRSFTAVTNPLVNSYKRLVPGYEAPVYRAWSAMNRSALVRVPASREKGTRVELRCPDPSCNPYLAFAVIVKAGLDGIRNRITPPPSTSKNIYDMSASEREEHGIESLAGNLYEAVRLLEQDSTIYNALGPHIAPRFVEAKLKEWDGYRTHVSGWEIDQYLSVV